jgi:selenide,water dikinase
VPLIAYGWMWPYCQATVASAPIVPRLTELCSTGGCAAKYDGAELALILEALPKPEIAELLVGLDPPDDAAIWQISDDVALVQTVDFFPPVVDDPFLYGRIAANNALNDVFAMGGTPKLALSIAAFPPELAGEDVASIVRGAAAQCAEVGAVLAGGHTIRDREPKFGLAVTGLVHPLRFWRKSGAKPGDRLLITKPLGNGLIVSGRRRGLISDAQLAEATGWMTASSAPIVNPLMSVEPSAVTDVTGFGLLGHALEVATQSRVRVAIDAARLPVIDAAHDCIAREIRTSAHGRNHELVARNLTLKGAVAESDIALALDPQTAGGLLLALDASRTDQFIAEMRRRDLPVWEIGAVEEGAGVVLAR